MDDPPKLEDQSTRLLPGSFIMNDNAGVHQGEQQDASPPPYAITKEEDALAQLRNLRGLTLVLAENNVKLQHQDDEIYSLSQNPRSLNGESFTFFFRVYRNRKSDRNDARVAGSKELYTVKHPYNWWNPKLRAFLCPMYSFSGEARSYYCYNPGFSLVKGNMKLLRWTPLIPFPVQNHLGPWRLVISTKASEKDLTFQLIRKRKVHSSPPEYEWSDVKTGVVALETTASTSLHMPTLKLKSDFEDRRLLHALVLAWVTIVWHDAKAEYAKDKAREIGKTMSCTSINNIYCTFKLRVTREAEA